MDAIPRYVPGRREYGVKTWLRMIYLLAGMGFLAFGLVLGPMLLRASASGLPAMLPGLFLLAFGIYMLATVVRSHLVIDGSRIEVRTAFRERSAEVGEIAGFRTIRSRNGNYIWLKLREGRGSITIPYTFDVDEDFSAWLRQVPDLDGRDRDVILGEIAEEQGLGATREERLAALPTARTWGAFLAIVAGIAAVALALAPPPLRALAAAVLAVTPLIAALLMHRAPLLYAIFKQKSDPRAELSYVLFVAAFGLLIHAGGLHMVRFQPLLVVAVPIALACFAGFAGAARADSGKPGIWFALAFFAGIYGFALAMVTDTLGNSTIVATYRPAVLDKHVSHVRSTSYSLTLEPWGERQQSESVGVSAKTYGLAAVGDSVCVEVHPGNLHVAWFRIAACDQGFPNDAP